MLEIAAEKNGKNIVMSTTYQDMPKIIFLLNFLLEQADSKKAKP
jgi:hypothetical protein